MTKAHRGNFIQSQTGATYVITLTNVGATATNGTVTVTDTVPSGLTATGIAGTGWTQAEAGRRCERGAGVQTCALQISITLTVNVAATAPASVTNTATVSGG